MLLVKTKIGPSAIHGIGLFADQFIPKGTVIWKFAEGFDVRVPADELARLAEPAKEQFLNYAYQNKDTNKFVLCFDDARFFNHSDAPNTESAALPDDEDGMTIASRDIVQGEEITCDYKEFDGDAARKFAGA